MKYNFRVKRKNEKTQNLNEIFPNASAKYDKTFEFKQETLEKFQSVSAKR